MSPNGKQSDGSESDASADFTRRGLMALGSVAGLGLAGAGMASANERSGRGPARVDDQGTGDGDANTVDGHDASQFVHVDGSVGGTRYVGTSGGEFESIAAAVADLPEDGIQHKNDEEVLNHKAGHVHVTPDYDYANEPEWPIKLHGNVALTTDPRRGATIAPPNNEVGIQVRAEADNSAGWQTNKQQPYISGFRMTSRNFLGDGSGKPKGFIKIEGGTGVVVDQCDLTQSKRYGIRITDSKYDFYPPPGVKTFDLWPIHVTIRNSVLRQCGDFNVWQVGGESNSLHCMNVLSRDAALNAYRLGGGSAPTTQNLIGCTAEKSGGDCQVMVKGVRNFNMWGSYIEGENDVSGVRLEYSGAEPTADIRGLYVNGADYVVDAYNSKTASVSHVSYYDVSEAVVAQNTDSSNVRVEPSTLRVCCGGNEVPAYHTSQASNKQTLRADGALVKQDLTSTGATGFYDGDLARHDGSGDSSPGVYMWDDEQSAWIGPDGSTV